MIEVEGLGRREKVAPMHEKGMTGVSYTTTVLRPRETIQTRTLDCLFWVAARCATGMSNFRKSRPLILRVSTISYAFSLAQL